MKRSWAVWLIVIVATALVVVGMSRRRAAQADSPPLSEFARSVELKPLGEIAIHRDGRINSVRSHTRAMMRLVSGPRKINGQTSLFSYLDLMFRPHIYHDVDIIFIKNKPMRGQIGEQLELSIDEELQAVSDEAMRAEIRQDFDNRLKRFFKTGLISPAMLSGDRVRSLLADRSTDLIRSAKFVEMIETAQAVARPDVLRGNLRIVPPPDGGIKDPWVTMDRFLVMSIDPSDTAAVERQDEVRTAWQAIEEGWSAQDATRVNEGVSMLSAVLPQLNSELYPSQSRASWPWSMDELRNWSWGASFGLLFVTAVLCGYSLSRRRPTLRSFAFATLGTLVALHGGALILGNLNPLTWESWYFSVYNMTWVWMIYLLSVIFLLLAVVYRWSPRRIGLGIFLLAFGLHSFAILLRWYVSDRWPNTNMFEAVTTAAWFGGVFAVLLEPAIRRTPMRGFIALGGAVASMVALMCAYYLPVALSADINNMMPVLHDVWLYIHTNVIIFSYCLIFMAAVSAIVYLLYRLGGGDRDYARVGGAGSLIMQTPDGGSYLTRARTSLGQILDGTTMVLMELSFVLLWAGLVMGAIWADHSWGRPWGWDPKEVFALNTFIVFAILVHVRLKTSDKALWTALIALVGAGVMLFNWIFINFFIVGLHSYA